MHGKITIKKYRKPTRQKVILDLSQKLKRQSKIDAKQCKMTPLTKTKTELHRDTKILQSKA